MASENRRPEGRQRRSPRILIASAVLLAVAILLLLLSLLESRPSLSFWRRNGFQILPGEQVHYAAAGNGLAAASTKHIQLFSSRGKCVASADAALSDPVCAGCALLGVYYDHGQTGFYALYPDGKTRRQDTDGPVLFADVNETGLVSVLTEKSGYKGCLMVYDTDLSPLFRWEAASGTPISVRADRNDRICVCCADDEGSVLHFFRIDRAEQQAEFHAPGEVILDVGFLSDGTVCAVTGQRLLFLTRDGTLIADHWFEEQRLDAYWINGDFAAVSTVTGLDGGHGVLSTLDSRGAVMSSCGAPREVLALSAAEDRLLVLFTGQESTLYTADLEELVSFQPGEDVRQVFLSADGRALFGGAERAVLIDFGRD